MPSHLERTNQPKLHTQLEESYSYSTPLPPQEKINTELGLSSDSDTACLSTLEVKRVDWDMKRTEGAAVDGETKFERRSPFKRRFYWGFFFPLFWLVNVILYLVQRHRRYTLSPSAFIVPLPTSHKNLRALPSLPYVDHSNRDEALAAAEARKYTLLSLYALYIFSLIVTGISVAIWAIGVLKVFERDVQRVGLHVQIG